MKAPAWIFLGLWFAYQVWQGHLGLVSPNEADGGTAFFAHVGGFVVGVVAAWVLVSRGAPRSGCRRRAAPRPSEGAAGPLQITQRM